MRWQRCGRLSTRRRWAHINRFDGQWSLNTTRTQWLDGRQYSYQEKNLGSYHSHLSRMVISVMKSHDDHAATILSVQLALPSARKHGTCSNAPADLVGNLVPIRFRFIIRVHSIGGRLIGRTDATNSAASNVADSTTTALSSFATSSPPQLAHDAFQRPRITRRGLILLSLFNSCQYGIRSSLSGSSLRWEFRSLSQLILLADTCVAKQDPCVPYRAPSVRTPLGHS